MRRLLLANIGWKLAALGVAVILWVGIVGQREAATSVYAPVVFRNLPRDLEISSDVPDRVHLEVQGSISGLSGLDNAAVVLDVGDVRGEGERTYTIRQPNLNVPPGVFLTRSVPAQIRLRFEKRVAREVPVHVRMVGRPPDGLRVADRTVTPSLVKIVGPESRVRQIDTAETDPVDVSRLKQTSDLRVPVFVSDQQVRIVGDGNVSVRIVVEKTL